MRTQRRCRFEWFVGVALVLAVAITAGSARALPRLASMDGAVRALVVYRGELIAAGDFTAAGTSAVNHIARWDGTRWQPLGAGTDAPVRALAVLGDRLCVGGDFSKAGGIDASHIALWDGSAWSPMGSGTDGPVHALLTRYGLFVYAGGSFTSAGGVPAVGVALWLNGVWEACGAGLAGTVSSLVLAGDQVVAAGDMRIVDGSPNFRYVVTYSGTHWEPLNVSLFVNGGVARVVTLYDGRLVIGGRFSLVWYQTPAGSVGHWAGTRWLPLSFGLSVGEEMGVADVEVLFPYAGGLVAGGGWDHADAQFANNVAFYDGSVWSPMGVGVDGRVLACTEYDGALIVGGEFTTAGGLPTPFIAAWDGIQWVNEFTPVVIQDVTIDANMERVRLCWGVAAAASGSLRGIRVQRGRAAAGPFEDRSGTLQPSARMIWEDALLPGTAWYRLLLESQAGTLASVGPWSVASGAHAGPAGILAAFDPGAANSVEIRYTLRAPGPVRLEIHDVRGRSVRAFAAAMQGAGDHIQTWDRLDDSGQAAPRGIYFVSLRAGITQSTRRLFLHSR